MMKDAHEMIKEMTGKERQMLYEILLVEKERTEGEIIEVRLNGVILWDEDFTNAFYDLPF